MKTIIDDRTGLVYRFYPLKKQLLINKKIIKEVAIWDHYQFNHGGFISDEIILEFVEKLHNTDYPFHRKNILKENGKRWGTYKHEPFYEEGDSNKNHRAYILIWYLREDKEILWVLNCYRRRNHDKK